MNIIQNSISSAEGACTLIKTDQVFDNSCDVHPCPWLLISQTIECKSLRFALQIGRCYSSGCNTNGIK